VIQASLWDKELRRKLQALQGQAKQRVYRRAFNRVGKPVAQKLQAAWNGAKRRRGSSTKQIAKAQEVKIRVFTRTSKTRGDAWMEIGTEYKRGGKAKIWHILERGFRHYSKSKAYGSKPSLYRAAASMRAHMAQAMKAAPKGKSRQARSARQAYKQAAAQEWASSNGAAAAELTAVRQKRATAVKAARRQGGSRIKGWLVSDNVARANVGNLSNDLARELLRGLALELKGGKA
jgi:hypothetical protein